MFKAEHQDKVNLNGVEGFRLAWTLKKDDGAHLQAWVGILTAQSRVQMILLKSLCTEEWAFQTMLL